MIQVVRFYKNRTFGQVHFFWNWLDAIKFGNKWEKLDNCNISPCNRNYIIQGN